MLLEQCDFDDETNQKLIDKLALARDEAKQNNALARMKRKDIENQLAARQRQQKNHGSSTVFTPEPYLKNEDENQSEDEVQLENKNNIEHEEYIDYLMFDGMLAESYEKLEKFKESEQNNE